MKNIILAISLALVTSTTAFAFDCASILGDYTCKVDNQEATITIAIEKENYLTISMNDEIWMVMNKDGSKFEFRYGPIKFDTKATCSQDGIYHAEAWTVPTKFSPNSEQITAIDASNNTLTLKSVDSDNESVTCVKK